MKLLKEMNLPELIIKQYYEDQIMLISRNNKCNIHLTKLDLLHILIVFFDVDHSEIKEAKRIHEFITYLNSVTRCIYRCEE